MGRIGIWLFLLLLPGYTFAQTGPLVLSPRVGAEIDEQERTYFGLFPRVVNFRTATVEPGPGQNATIVINGGAATPIMATPFQLKELARLVDNYEAAIAGEEKIQWEYMVRLAEQRKAVEPFALQVGRADGSMASGILVYVDHRMMLLASEEVLANAYKNADVLELVLLGDVSTLRGRRLDIAYDGSEAQTERLVARLIPRAMLQHGLSPELHSAFGQFALAVPSVRPEIPAEPIVLPPGPKWHVGVAFHPSGLEASVGLFETAISDFGDPVQGLALLHRERLSMEANRHRVGQPFSHKIQPAIGV